MKVLSLLQPWASLLFIERPGNNRKAAKGWETRGWRPSPNVLLWMEKEGCLIHASTSWKKPQVETLRRWPFSDYIKSENDLPRGSIIGKVQFGEIITTEAWKARFSHFEDGAIEAYREEYEFGDYRDGRFAWEIKSFNKLSTPIPCKGALGLWPCPTDILKQILQQRNVSPSKY
jgi:hypothetical protein